MTVPYSSVTRRRSASRVQRPLWFGLQCFSLAWREQTSMFFAISYDTDFWTFSSPVESPRKGNFAEYASRDDKSRPFLKFRFERNNGQDCPISAENTDNNV